MAEKDRPVYCTQCGSIVYPGDNFCGVCGARVPPDAPSAVPTQQIPTQVHAPPGVPTPSRNLTPVMLLGMGAALVLLLGVGSVAALTLLRGGTDSPEAEVDRVEAPAGVTETTGPNESIEEPTTPKAAKEDNDAEKADKKPTREQVSGPAPGYNIIRTPDGGLTVEVPQSWGVETGQDSEKQAGPNTWSYYAGEYLNSSITTATSLEAWYSTAGVSGAYIVASKELAQSYTNDELIHSLLLKGKANRCTRGPYKDYNRPPYSGKIQTWNDCGVNDVTSYTVAAAPEGRECVVVLDALLVSEADRKAVQHIVDTFEVDCGRVTSEALATASESPSPTADATPSATPSPSPNPNASPNPNYNAPNPNAPNPNAAGNATQSPAAAGGGDINCDQVDGPIPTPPGDPNNLDGDNDGWACE